MTDPVELRLVPEPPEVAFTTAYICYGLFLPRACICGLLNSRDTACTHHIGPYGRPEAIWFRSPERPNVCHGKPARPSEVYGTNATPFEHGRPRKVVVQQEDNTIIGMGGVHQDLVRFELL